MAPELDTGRADRRSGHVLDELLDPRHRVPVVRVGLVPLEHRELGLVLVRDALVPEVLADLVHALEASDDEALEVELGRDPQVEVGVELVRARHERMSERAPVARLQDRRLDLDEPVRVEVATDRRDDARAQEEELARVLVHEQVEIPLPIARLGVGDAVEGVGERAAVLREDLELVHGERGLPAARRGRRPDDPDDVAEVDVDTAGPALVAEELDATRAVDEVEERQLPVPAPRHDPAGETALRVRLGARLERDRLLADRGYLVAVGEALRGTHGPRVYGHRRRGAVARGCDERLLVRARSACTADVCRRDR